MLASFQQFVRARTYVPHVPAVHSRMVELPLRGRTLVTELSGPPGAPTVVLLHAVGCTGLLTWFPALEALAEQYHVVTFDQRWHGRGIQSEYFSLRDCADDVAALADVLGLDRVIVAGYSMGSIVAQRVWRQHPSLTAGLVLAATTDRFRTTTAERSFHAGMELSMGVLRTMARSRSLGQAGRLTAQMTLDALDLDVSDAHEWALGQWRQTSPWAVAQAVAALGRHHSRPWLHDIDVPTSVVLTRQDHVIPPARQRALARRIPGAVVHSVEAGHAACVLQADRFVPVFVQAVDDVAARIEVTRSGQGPDRRGPSRWSVISSWSPSSRRPSSRRPSSCRPSSCRPSLCTGFLGRAGLLGFNLVLHRGVERLELGGELSRQSPDVRHRLTAGVDADVHLAVVAHHGDVQPGPVEDRAQRVEGLDLGAE